MEDKILMAEALNNTGWHLPTWNRPACCGSVRQCADRPSPVLISTIILSILSIWSCLSKQADFGDVTGSAQAPGCNTSAADILGIGQLGSRTVRIARVWE